MIIGIGTDLLDIRRIERTLKRYGERFVARIFTESERARAYGRVNPAAAFAQRYAAKEACAKALGTGLRQGVYWRDMAVEDLPSGKPLMVLTGGARKRLDALTPAGMKGDAPAAPGGKRGVSPRHRYAGDAPAAPGQAP